MMVLQKGSSGSPLIDQNHRVVGQLHGDPNYDRTIPFCDQRYGEYGKFSMSWNYGGSSSTRLRDWLDPDNTSATVLDGLEDGMLSEGELPASATWSGSHTLTGNIYIPSGVILTIASNTTINLNGNSIIFTGGTIVNNGTISDLRAIIKDRYTSVVRGYFSTVQAAVNAADNDDRIYIEDGPFTESISISGKDNLFISGGELNGSITATNSDELYISQTKCTSMILNNCDDPYLNGADIIGNGSGTGIYLFNIGLSLQPYSYCIVGNLSTGLYAINSTFGIQNETLFTSLTNGVSSNYSSNITLNQIQLCGISNYHLAAYTNGSIDANWCYYDNGTAIIHESGGYVDVIVENDCSQALMASKYTKTSTDGMNIDPAKDEFRKINNMLSELSKLIGSEMDGTRDFDKEKYKDDLLEIVNLFKNYIKDNPNSQYRGAAITIAVHCYKGIEEYELMREFLEELKNDSEIGGYAKRYMIDYYQEQKDYDKALSVADELLKEEKADIDLTNTVLYTKGLLLAHDMDKPEEAAECFSILLQKTFDEGFTALAENELRILGLDAEKQITTDETDDSEELVLENYPNPFNPTTTIAVSLPKQADIKLIVYDVLGREIIKLADGNFEAGKHDFKFNAANLSSGVYFYNIRTSGQSITKKMLLIK